MLRVAAGGDEDAFGMLWYDLQSRLLRYFKVIAAGAAEDLASETWVVVLRTKADPGPAGDRAGRTPGS